MTLEVVPVTWSAHSGGDEGGSFKEIGKRKEIGSQRGWGQGWWRNGTHTNGDCDLIDLGLGGMPGKGGVQEHSR